MCKKLSSAIADKIFLKLPIFDIHPYPTISPGDRSRREYLR